MPERIQLRRTKGWRKPDGAIVVARPTRWGNPYTLTDVGRRFPSLTTEQCAGFVVNEFRDLTGWWTLTGRFTGDIDMSAPRTLTDSLPPRRLGDRRERRTVTYPSIDEIQAELAGHDLACWCPLDQPCHADVLLELANAIAP